VFWEEVIKRTTQYFIQFLIDWATQPVKDLIGEDSPRRDPQPSNVSAPLLAFLISTFYLVILHPNLGLVRKGYTKESWVL
jgi:hypothetical protein